MINVTHRVELDVLTDLIRLVTSLSGIFHNDIRQSVQPIKNRQSAQSGMRRARYKVATTLDGIRLHLNHEQLCASEICISFSRVITRDSSRPQASY